MGMNGSTPEINLNTFPHLNGKILTFACYELKVTIPCSISLPGKEKPADFTLKDLDPRYFFRCANPAAAQDTNQHKKLVFYLFHFQIQMKKVG